TSRCQELLSRGHAAEMLRVTFNAGAFLACRLERPSHARSVVSDAEAAAGVEQNYTAVTGDAVLQVLHRLEGHPLRRVPGEHSVSGPFRQHQLHDRFAPAGGRGGGAFVIGIAATTNE